MVLVCEASGVEILSHSDKLGTVRLSHNNDRGRLEPDRIGQCPGEMIVIGFCELILDCDQFTGLKFYKNIETPKQTRIFTSVRIEGSLPISIPHR